MHAVSQRAFSHSFRPNATRIQLRTYARAHRISSAYLQSSQSNHPSDVSKQSIPNPSTSSNTPQVPSDTHNPSSTSSSSNSTERRARRRRIIEASQAKSGEIFSGRIRGYLSNGRSERAIEYVLERAKNLDLVRDAAARLDVERAVLAFVRVEQLDDALRLHDELLAKANGTHHYRLVIAAIRALQPLSDLLGGDPVEYIRARRLSRQRAITALIPLMLEEHFSQADLRKFLYVLEDMPHVDAELCMALTNAFIKSRGPQYHFDLTTSTYLSKLKARAESEERDEDMDDFDKNLLATLARAGVPKDQLQEIASGLKSDELNHAGAEDVDIIGVSEINAAAVNSGIHRLSSDQVARSHRVQDSLLSSRKSTPPISENTRNSARIAPTTSVTADNNSPDSDSASLDDGEDSILDALVKSQDKHKTEIATAYLSELRRQDRMTKEHVDNTLKEFVKRGIPANRSFVNALVAIAVRDKDYQRAFFLYSVMQRSPSSDNHPDAYTYSSLFTALSSVSRPRTKRTRAVKIFEGGPPPRTLFREMVARHLQATDGHPRARSHIITTSSLNIALRAMLARRDYPGALAVLGAFKELWILADLRTYQNVFVALISHSRTELSVWKHAKARFSEKEERWVDRFWQADRKLTADDMGPEMMRFLHRFMIEPHRTSKAVPSVAMIRGLEYPPRGKDTKYNVAPLSKVLIHAIRCGYMRREGFEQVIADQIDRDIAVAWRETMPDRGSSTNISE